MSRWTGQTAVKSTVVSNSHATIRRADARTCLAPVHLCVMIAHPPTAATAPPRASGIRAITDAGARTLLLHSARAGAAAEGSALARAVGDWTDVVDAALHHGVAPALHVLLDGAAPAPVPAAARQLLRDAWRDGAKRALVGSVALRDVLAALRTAGIDALPLKGPALAEDLYADPALRPFSDLDILVRQRDAGAALSVLASFGYRLPPPLRKVDARTLAGVTNEVTVEHPERMAVDVHWQVAAAGYPFRFDPDLLWRSARPLPFHGEPVLAPGREALLLFLCVHAARHAWSRLMWLGDIARIAHAGPDWDAAIRVATEARCMRPLLLGLVLAHEVLDAPVPPAIVDRARAEPALVALAKATTRSFFEVPDADPRFVATRFTARLADRLWDKAMCYAALLAPTQAELECLALPPAMTGLYYPFRFARLAVKYAALRPRGR
jgi:hypothetical protein